MELIRISDCKLKVMLTPEDMERFELDTADMDYETRKTKRAFWEILDEVKQKCGFTVGTERVLVQVFPSGDGGCELFVTKLTGLSAREGEGSEPKRGVTMVSARTGAYRFESFDRLLHVCRELSVRGYDLESAAYAGEGEEWYLFLQEQAGASTSFSELSFIGEYGERFCGSASLTRIREHGRCVIPRDAVRLLTCLGS